MANTNYFWQGGRKIEVRQDESEITIHAGTSAEVDAEGAGVSLRAVRPVAPGMVRAEVAGDRDAAMERLRSQRKVVHHVYRASQPSGSEYIIDGTFFVKFKEGTAKSRMQDYIAAEHLEVVQQLDALQYLVRVTDATGRNAIRSANAAATREDVEYAEPNLVRKLERFFIPADPLFSSQWHLHAPAAGTDLVAGAGIFAPEAWDVTRGRREVVVAVADDGFDLTHPDFVGEGKIIGQLNAAQIGAGGAIQWDANVHPRAGDYHGTPCLGVALAEGNGTGAVGVANGCGLVAVRFPLSMSDAHFITMFRKISTVADVVSCSWGVGPADAPMSSALRSEMASLARTGGRRGKGLIFCIAAGNNNAPVQDLANTRTYRFRTSAGIRSYSGPIDRWVAAHPDVITVSACTSLKTRSAYSSWGKNISVCAPSDNWDDLGAVAVPGRGITTTDNEGAGEGSDFTQGSRFTSEFGGTSSATPTVAGICGLVLSANSSLTALEVRDIIQSTADKDLSLVTHTPVNEPGNFDALGFSLWFGHGKVNAFRAVSEAAQQSGHFVDVKAEPALAIPDSAQPVFSSIDVTDQGVISEMRIQVDISHSFIGDLQVDLITPTGGGIALHRNTGGSAHNLVKTYSAQDVLALRPLIGTSIRGEWKLRIADTFAIDVGTLNAWRIVARVTTPAGPGPSGPQRTGAAAPSRSRSAGRGAAKRAKPA